MLIWQLNKVGAQNGQLGIQKVGASDDLIEVHFDIFLNKIGQFSAKNSDEGGKKLSYWHVDYVAV